jgi:hypothetical protein
MSFEDNKSLVQRYYEQVVNTGNIDRVVDGRIVEHGGGGQHLRTTAEDWSGPGDRASNGVILTPGAPNRPGAYRSATDWTD